MVKQKNSEYLQHVYENINLSFSSIRKVAILFLSFK